MQKTSQAQLYEIRQICDKIFIKSQNVNTFQPLISDHKNSSLDLFDWP